ncbi:Hypothetical protein PAB1840 [Pyrococcus abyssi GE5]|uniref:Uncharacterized protein n=2 Tax=Pyrococcus abyssi TaxID=29292 RepID=Q9V0K4_PYRAB|nr:Hypothetical protein PAB1840 [Pyrococcus abyssi GE5]CCE70182.1 TPA: hypothetical protein PAB1840 [Pyrococcus abyssi GE5]
MNFLSLKLFESLNIGLITLTFIHIHPRYLTKISGLIIFFALTFINHKYIFRFCKPTGGMAMGLSGAAWATLIVPTVLAFVVMVLYGFWDKITGKEYYVDEEILAYDQELVEGRK